MVKKFKTKIAFPPTINHLYKRSGHRTYIDKKGVAWFEAAIWDIKTTPGYSRHKFKGRLRIEIWLVPPTAHKYDFDNRLKALLDSIQQSELIENDSQFYESAIHKFDKQPGGRKDSGCFFEISELPKIQGVLFYHRI